MEGWQLGVYVIVVGLWAGASYMEWRARKRWLWYLEESQAREQTWMEAYRQTEAATKAAQKRYCEELLRLDDIGVVVLEGPVRQQMEAVVRGETVQ